MELALEVLRLAAHTNALVTAKGALLYGDSAAKQLGNTVADGIGSTPWRLLRARLALYLRAVLRADRGDYGPEYAWCAACAQRRGVVCHDGGPWHCLECARPAAWTSRITPLWQLARPHGVTGNARCEHRDVVDGPRVPLRYGSAATQVCQSCGAWRTMHHQPGRWTTRCTVDEAAAEEPEE